jgi:glycine reductase
VENDFMRLELCCFSVKDVVFGEVSGFSDGILRIDRGEVEKSLCNEGKFRKLNIDIARPGEMARIIHIIDVIEPRAKFGGNQRIFPGFLGPPTTVGSGVTHKLENVAVMTTADMQTRKDGEGPSSLTRQNERLVDMTGEAAIYSPFSKTTNIVLYFEPSPDISIEEFEDAIRRAGLWVAEYLAKLTGNNSPDYVNSLDLEKIDHHDLPRVAYVYQVQSNGFVRDTYLYGEHTRHLMPTLIHPNEITDGAIVNGSQSYAASPTYIHQNNKVIKGLYERHGKELNFVGVIFLTRHHLTHRDKERKACYAAKLAKMLGADGIISTQEGGGNSIVDQMLTIKSCEDFGIKTVALTYEIGGAEGKDFPLIYHVKEADALVSTGDREQLVHMPEMERVIGGTHLLYRNIPAKNSLDCLMIDIISSFNQAGFWKLRGWDY